LHVEQAASGGPTREGHLFVLSIALSQRALAAARRVDPQVSTAAVRAAVEAALDDGLRDAAWTLVSPEDDAELS
jgi:hypothetical protein